MDTQAGTTDDAMPSIKSEGSSSMSVISYRDMLKARIAGVDRQISLARVDLKSAQLAIQTNQTICDSLVESLVKAEEEVTKFNRSGPSTSAPDSDDEVHHSDDQYKSGKGKQRARR